VSNNFLTKKKSVSPCFSTDNMLQNACKKFEVSNNDVNDFMLRSGNMPQNSCENFKLSSNNLRRKRCVTLGYCTCNLLLNACEKFKLLTDNCLAKNYVFPHAFVLEICFKMPVKNLNSWQTIVWQKRCDS
jgi:hypothetical protein